MNAKRKKSSQMDRLGLCVQVMMFTSFAIFIDMYICRHLIWGPKKGVVYAGKIQNIGFLTHAATGSLYLVTGALQFVSSLRRYAPRLHRFLGYVFYLMVLLTSLSILVVATKPQSGVSAQLATAVFLPLWLYFNAASYHAIAVAAPRNIESHRVFNILGLSLASSIIAMRPCTVFVIFCEPTWSFARANGLANWVCLSVFLLLTSAFLIANGDVALSFRTSTVTDTSSSTNISTNTNTSTSKDNTKIMRASTSNKEEKELQEEEE